ncbi:MAG: VCBS repeat-containing protein [Planctomycetota bacterium]
MRKLCATLVLLVVGAITARAQTIFDNNPNWRSSDRHYATGGQFVDLDRDGWPDFVVSNGNDMAVEKVGVYYNQAGTLQSTPGWWSSDSKYHGHLTVGDIDQDGWEDVVVAVLVAQNGYGVKYYRNNAGTLSSLPDWTSSNSFYGWHCALGDPDLDGDLDLLIGSSDAYGSGRWKNFIYFNTGGALERTPSWQTDDTRNLDHMEFCDVDLDGDLDVVAIGSGTCNWLYRNEGGVVSTVPDWNSSDNNNQMANTLALGDCTGDGRPDLIMSDNNQLGGGSGRFKMYRGLPTGSFESTYSWSYYDGMVSAVALADLNGDGHLDLATGAWWDKIRLFLNNGSGFPASPSWNGNPTIVVEAICFADVNRDGLVTRRETKDIFTGKTTTPNLVLNAVRRIWGGPARHLFYLDKQPVEEILRVVVDGSELPITAYCVNRQNGWVSLKNPPTQSVMIEYVYSTKLDMGVTDWENNGNLLFYHR